MANRVPEGSLDAKSVKKWFGFGSLLAPFWRQFLVICLIIFGGRSWSVLGASCIGFGVHLAPILGPFWKFFQGPDEK